MDNRLTLEKVNSNNLQRAIRESIITRNETAQQNLQDYALHVLNLSKSEYEFASQMARVALK